MTLSQSQAELIFVSLQGRKHTIKSRMRRLNSNQAEERGNQVLEQIHDVMEHVKFMMEDKRKLFVRHANVVCTCDFCVMYRREILQFKTSKIPIEGYYAKPDCERGNVCNSKAVVAATTSETNSIWLLCAEDAQAMERGEVWW